MLKNLILVLVLLCTLGYNLFGQGIIRGKIYDIKGESIIGASLSFRSNSSTGSTSDFDGNYELAIPSTSFEVLIITYLGYTTIRDSFEVAKGKVVVKNYEMVEQAAVLTEVVVSAKGERSKNYFMENLKKNSAVSLDYVSSESMKKIGDSNVTSAISRVSGVSTNGSFITVRGIGDRYVLTSINGAQIPTLDPFTNNIKLDIVPASLVDNVIITKTASPDLPGDWTGAYISVETKDYPEKFTLNVESQVGYNPNSSLRNVLSTQNSSTDWLGFDDGFRKFDHANYKNLNYNPSLYDKFIALGLGDYYAGLGLNSDWTKLSPEAQQEFTALGYNKLGLLGKGEINNQAALLKANQAFVANGLSDKAFRIINEDAAKIGASLPNNWKSFKKRAPLNYSQSFSLGNQTKLFGKSLGYILGFRYNSQVQYDPNSVADRSQGIINDGVAARNDISNPEIAKFTNGWSALINLAYKFNSNNSISFLFMPNFIGVNNLREGIIFSAKDAGNPIFGSAQFYEQRQQLIYQVKSTHFIPKRKVKIDFNASYTSGKSDAPDFKRYRFFTADDNPDYFYDGPAFADDPLVRDFRELKEKLLDTKLSFEFPINKNQSLPAKLKIGAAYKSLSRKYDQYNYGFLFGNGDPLAENGDLNQFFDQKNFLLNGDTNTTVNYYYTSGYVAPTHTIGKSEVAAVYAMTDITIVPTFRVSGGVRVEQVDMFADADLYNANGYANGDFRRVYQVPLLMNAGRLNKLSVLPSVNFIYKLKNDDDAPMNLRLNYSRSVARPSIREYSESVIYDFELRANVFGNSNLKMVDINNYDLRLESYFKNGDNISVSLFYKDFKNHIEVINFQGQGFSWSNADDSYVVGIEIEGRKKIIKNLEIRLNASFVKSQSNVVPATLEVDPVTLVQKWIYGQSFARQMFGQAPLVLNCILNYEIPDYGLSASMAYNVQAARLVLTGFNDDPDIYEMPRHLVDFKLSKTIVKKFGISFTVKDILNSPIRRSYKFDNDKGYLVDFDSIRFGTNYSISISYKI